MSATITCHRVSYKIQLHPCLSKNGLTYLKDGHKSQHKTKSSDKMTATLLTNSTKHSPSELTAVQFVKKFTVVMEPQGSIPCPQETAILPILFLYDPFQYYAPVYA